MWKLFQCFIAHVTTSESEIKINSAAERVLKLFPTYFSNIQHVGKYSCAEIKLFQMNVDEG